MWIQLPGFFGSPPSVTGISSGGRSSDEGGDHFVPHRADSNGDTALMGPTHFPNGETNSLRAHPSRHLPGEAPAAPATPELVLESQSADVFAAFLAMPPYQLPPVMAAPQVSGQPQRLSRRDPGDDLLPSHDSADLAYYDDDANQPASMEPMLPNHTTHRLPVAICHHFNDAQQRTLAQLGGEEPPPTNDDSLAEDKQRAREYRFVKSLSTATWQPPGTLRHLEYQLNQAINNYTTRVFVDRYANSDNKPFADFYSSMCSTEAGGWLNAAGTFSSRTRMTNDEYLFALHLRLQTVPLGTPALTTFCSSCTADGSTPVPHSIHHCFKCTVMHGANIDRHDSIRDLIIYVAKLTKAGPFSLIDQIVKEPVMQYYAHRKQTVTNELKSAVQKRLLPALITRDVPSAETEAASSSASQIDANTALPEADAYSQVAAAAAVAYAALPDGADDVPAQPSSASSSNSATSDAASAPASSDVDPATNKLHRADVYISTKPKSDSILNTQGQQMVIDVTGTHPVTGLFPSRRGEPAVRGKQAEARAAAKHKHYNNRYDTNILDVIPFVLETGGFINREGLAFISLLARLMCTSGIREHGIPVTYTRARATLTQQLSTTLQIHNARAYRSYLWGSLRHDIPAAKVQAWKLLHDAANLNHDVPSSSLFDVPRAEVMAPESALAPSVRASPGGQ